MSYLIGNQLVQRLDLSPVSRTERKDKFRNVDNPTTSGSFSDSSSIQSTNASCSFFGNAVIGLRFESSKSGGPFP
jgi:hypothetical protein